MANWKVEGTTDAVTMGARNSASIFGNISIASKSGVSGIIFSQIYPLALINYWTVTNP